MSSKYTRVRRLKENEIFYNVAQKEFNVEISHYWLKLGSKEKLKTDDVENALRILYRSCDNLSLCIREEDGNQWFCRMKTENIDFEVINNKSAWEVFEDGKHKHFESSEGPLWRVKYIMESTEESSSSSTASSEEGEWSSDIIFSIHHGITDGNTTTRMCSAFLKILNDIISGSEIKEYDSFGKFSEGLETDQLIQEREEFLQKNPHIYEKLKTELFKISNQNVTLTQIFSVPKNVVWETKHSVRVLDIDTTTKLIDKFKTEGITFHSGFTAVATWALMDVFSEHGCSLDSIDIGILHDINIRRYWQKSSYFQQGCHIGSVRMIIPTDKNVGEKFWPYSKTIHNRLSNYITESRPIDEKIVFPLNADSIYKDLAELSNDPLPPEFYFCISNMGDLSSIFKDTGEHVHMNWITRATPCHNGNTAMVHIFQTYKGKFMYGLDYSTKYVTDKLAEKYIENIFNKLMQLVN